jgi:hypothetical protein
VSELALMLYLRVPSLEWFVGDHSPHALTIAYRPSATAIRPACPLPSSSDFPSRMSVSDYPSDCCSLAAPLPSAYPEPSDHPTFLYSLDPLHCGRTSIIAHQHPLQYTPFPKVLLPISPHLRPLPIPHPLIPYSLMALRLTSLALSVESNQLGLERVPEPVEIESKSNGVKTVNWDPLGWKIHFIVFRCCHPPSASFSNYSKGI